MRRTVKPKKRVYVKKSKTVQRSITILVPASLYELLCLCAASQNESKVTLIKEILKFWAMEVSSEKKNMITDLEEIVKGEWKAWVLKNKSFEFSGFRNKMNEELLKKGVNKYITLKILNNIENGEDK